MTFKTNGVGQTCPKGRCGRYCLCIWARSEKMREWEVQVLFWVEKVKLFYSRTRNVQDIGVLVPSYFCLVEWVCPFSPFPIQNRVNPHPSSWFLPFPPSFPFYLPFWEVRPLHPQNGVDSAFKLMTCDATNLFFKRKSKSSLWAEGPRWCPRSRLGSICFSGKNLDLTWCNSHNLSSLFLWCICSLSLFNWGAYV